MAVISLKPIKKTYRRGEAVINGVSLYDRGIKVSKRPAMTYPSRSADYYIVPGRDGFYTIDHDSYGERSPFNLELSVYAANEEEMEAKRAYLASLIGAQVALELYNHPYSTFLGTVSEMSNIEESVALGNSYTVTLTFKLQPYRQVRHENKNVTVNRGDSFVIPYGKLHLVLTLDGPGGDVSFSFGGVQYSYKGVPSGKLVVDILHMRSYLKEGYNETNMSHTKDSRNKSYPSYQSGQVITWSANYSMTAVLDWRAL